MYLCENAEWFKFMTKAPVLNTAFPVEFLYFLLIHYVKSGCDLNEAMATGRLTPVGGLRVGAADGELIKRGHVGVADSRALATSL